MMAMQAGSARRRRGEKLLAALLLATCVTACQTLGVPERRSVSAEVGSNLIDEPCRVVSARAEQGSLSDETDYNVFCGKWEQPSAKITRLQTDTPTQQLANGGQWRERLDAFATCGQPIATKVLDSAAALALDCTLGRGGWPYQALIWTAGNGVYAAHGIPAALPAMERAIGLLSGLSTVTSATPSGQVSAEMARVEARLAGGLYSTGDLEHYRDLLRVAQYHNYQGRFAEAEKRYREALALQKKAVAGDSGGEGFILMHLALELSNQQRFAEADAMFDRAEALLSRSLEPTDEARLTSYRAIHLANQRKDSEAAAMARKASEARLALAREYRPDLSAFLQLPSLMSVGAGIADATGRLAGPVLESRASTALGDVVQSKYVEGAMLLRGDRLQEADRTLSEAVAIYDADVRVPRRWLPQIQLLQADIAERKGDLGTAEGLIKTTIQQQRVLLTGSRTEATALVALGRVQVRAGKDAEALSAYRAAFSILRPADGDLTFGQTWPYFRAALRESERAPSQRQGLFAEMFEVAQMVRGGTTAQTLALATARLSSSSQEVAPLIRDLQDARRDRDIVNERLTLAQADPNTLPPQMQALDAEWKAVNAKIADLERQVQAAAPRYNQILDAPVPAYRLREALEQDEALAQFLVGPEGAVGFFIDAEGFEAYLINLTEAQAKAKVAQLRAPFDASKFDAYDTRGAHELFLSLFGSVRDRLANAGHLIVVPSGALLSLPPGVLVEDVPPTADTKPDYTQVMWLTRRHGLTLAPSVRSFLNLRTTATPSRAAQPFLGFGDFVPARDVDAVLAMRGLPEGCKKDVITVAGAPALPNTAAELRSVANALGTSERLVVGEAFSEQGVKTANLGDYRVVYFATHGLLPQELNCWNEPSLITSKPPSENNDGLLTASEVVDLKLDANLVVLSACNTGGPGVETGGESLSGLARAFFYAGARSMLVTHWRIPDAPTVQLMVSTFEQLGTSDVTPAEALRRSQLRLIANPRSAHPLNWGAFTLVGDGGRRLSPATDGKAMAAGH